MMDNTGDGSKINLEAAAIMPIHQLDEVLLRPSILGQYVAPNGFGGYAGISMSILGSSGDSAIGSLELGGLFRRELSTDVDLGLRVGLILPTATHRDMLLHFASTLIARPADWATVSPDTTWLRLGVSPTFHRGPFFLRADLGVDVAVRGGGGVDPFGHVNVGAGIGHDKLSATAEMQTVFTTEPGGHEITSFHTAGLSARYHGNWVSPFVLVSTPLDKGFRGEVVTATTGLTLLF